MPHAALILGPAIIFAALSSSIFMALAVVVGLPRLAQGSEFWWGVWITFDKLVNGLLGGDFNETISSRLGKSIYHNHPPVFGSFDADFTIALLLEAFEENHCFESINWLVGRTL